MSQTVTTWDNIFSCVFITESVKYSSHYSSTLYEIRIRAVCFCRQGYLQKPVLNAYKRDLDRPK
jgi:hypothetical protein